MSDRIKYVKVIFDDIGRIVRVYKSVHFSGEGAPRDVEIEAGEMLQLFGAANAVGVAAMSEMESRMRQAEASQNHTEEVLAQKMDALNVLGETNAKLEAALARAEAAKVEIAEDLAKKAATVETLTANIAKLQSDLAKRKESEEGDS